MATAVRLVDLSSHVDSRGALTVVEEHAEGRFAVKRAYFIYDVPPGGSRAGHAHRNSCNMLIAIAGSFHVHVDDGCHKASFRLDVRTQGLVIPERTWLSIDDFSQGSVCLVLSSRVFQDEQYWRDYDEFCRAVGDNQ